MLNDSESQKTGSLSAVAGSLYSADCLLVLHVSGVQMLTLMGSFLSFLEGTKFPLPIQSP